ncbi:hypothetical protein MJO29_013483 [Puccinia striiformis f. sp. tritici]|nr:hypothetical protein MJO29_013483 [Puccinia striiformis f. sp. tritici]
MCPCAAPEDNGAVLLTSEELATRQNVTPSGPSMEAANQVKDTQPASDFSGIGNASDNIKPLQVNHASQNPWRVQTQTHSILIFAAIWGLLTRLGVTAIGNFNGQNIFSLLLVQVVGCLIMGISVALQPRFGKIHPLLYFGITTGYCGSVTTFSSWMLQVFQAFSNTLTKFSRGRFSDTGLLIGNSIEYTIISRARQTNLQPRHDTPAFGKILAMVVSAAGPLTWLGSIFVFTWGPISWRGPVTYSMMIAPSGTILRYYLAKLNLRQLSTNNGFPTGTFLANVIATALLALFSALQYTSAALINSEYVRISLSSCTASV